MLDRAIGIIIAIISLATLAVVLSKRSDTAKVLDVSLKGITGLIKAAISPITN